MKLVAIIETPKKRMLGSAKGKITIADDFNDPLSEDLLREFEK